MGEARNENGKTVGAEARKRGEDTAFRSTRLPGALPTALCESPLAGDGGISS
jgi:hypothetical protein